MASSRVGGWDSNVSFAATRSIPAVMTLFLDLMLSTGDP